MNSMIKGEEISERAYFSLITCLYSFVFIVSSFEIDFRAKKCYFALSVTKNTWPNCPYPNFRRTSNYSSFKFLDKELRFDLRFF